MPGRTRQFFSRYALFLRDVSTLAGGRALVVAIKLALIPVIARLFVPEDFGVLAVVLGIASVCGALATFRYERAIVLPPGESEALRLAWLTLWLLLAASVVLTVAVSLALASGALPANYAQVGGWLYVLPTAVTLTGLVQIQEAWATRVGRFAPIALGEILQTLLTSLSRIGFGLAAGSSVAGLVASFLLGLLGKAGLLWRQLASLAPRAARPSAQELRETAAAWRDFPLHNAPTALLRDFSAQMPTFAFAFLYDPAMAGFFAMASRLVWPVVNTSAVAIRRVFIQRMASYLHAGRSLMRPTLLATGGMTLIGIAPFAVLWLAGESLVPFLLGENWRTAGRFVALLSPLFFIGWMTTPTGAILVLLRKQAIGLWIHLFTALARAAAFAHAWLAGLGAEVALLEYALASIAGNFAMFGTALWLVRRERALGTENK